ATPRPPPVHALLGRVAAAVRGDDGAMAARLLGWRPLALPARCAAAGGCRSVAGFPLSKAVGVPVLAGQRRGAAATRESAQARVHGETRWPRRGGAPHRRPLVSGSGICRRVSVPEARPSRARPRGDDRRPRGGDPGLVAAAAVRRCAGRLVPPPPQTPQGRASWPVRKLRLRPPRQPRAVPGVRRRAGGDRV
ncbi:MAG: hypothetical protein AVDCRST_MAG64-671, partial [uncultured Phycisphaerae bacterium]